MIKLRSTREDQIALGWGLAEAVLFFIIPDVFLSLVAIKSGFRRAGRAALFATVGAILGGLVMYGWGTVDPAGAFAAMDKLPGIDVEMINTVQADVATHGNPALLTGPLRGRPYKLFAAASGELDLSIVGLVLLTVPGRLGRFLIAIGVAAYLRWFFSRWLSDRVLLVGWAVFWVVVYAGYWFG